MMALINRLQTTNPVQQPGSAPAPSAPAHVPPPMPPQLFACPDRQQVVPGVRPPEARSDLVDLMRVVNDHIAAAMGVPASVIFEGKFSSNSMSQCATRSNSQPRTPLPDPTLPLAPGCSSSTPP